MHISREPRGCDSQIEQSLSFKSNTMKRHFTFFYFMRNRHLKLPKHDSAKKNWVFLKIISVIWKLIVGISYFLTHSFPHPLLKNELRSHYYYHHQHHYSITCQSHLPTISAITSFALLVSTLTISSHLFYLLREVLEPVSVAVLCSNRSRIHCPKEFRYPAEREL